MRRVFWRGIGRALTISRYYTIMMCCGPSLDPACWQRRCLSTLSPSLQWPALRKEGAIKVMKDAGVDISSFTSDAMADAVLKTESNFQGFCVHVSTSDVVLSKGAALGGPGVIYEDNEACEGVFLSDV